MMTPLISWICYSISMYLLVGVIYGLILIDFSKKPLPVWFMCSCWPIRLLVDIVNLKDAIFHWHDKQNIKTNSPPISKKPPPPPAPPSPQRPTELPKYNGYKMSRV